MRAKALIEAGDALPAAERANKLHLLARAAVDAKGVKDPAFRLMMSGLVAERWLDLGESARGKALLRATQADAEKMPNAAFVGYARGAFAEELAQIDLKAALALTATLTDPSEFDRHHGNIAHELAAREPAEAERVLAMVRAPVQRERYAVPVVYRMAGADLPRARRIAGAIHAASPRAYALGMAALGLADAGKRADAAGLLAEAFVTLGGPSAGHHDRATVAAVLLSVAERIDPERVAESFWKALSLRGPKPAPGQALDLHVYHDAELALALARYDRATARTLLAPLGSPDALAASRVGPGDVTYTAAAVIDPRWAVGLVDALPADPDLNARGETNSARLAVARVLARRGVNRWRFLTHQHFNLWVPDAEDMDPNL